jgi:uncharacterized cupredoxin-like copper-binding protein
LNWTKQVPMEIRSMHITTTGFELEFTKPVDRQEAANTDHYKMTGFTYSYHKKYGSPVINSAPCQVQKAEVSGDGLRVKLTVSGLRAGYIHELKINDLFTKDGEAILHPLAYYTINSFPEGTQQTHHHADHQGEQTTATACGNDPGKSVQNQPEAWTKGADTTIVMSTKPGLKFDKELLEVKAGSKVKLSFNNNDDMLHNLVITTPGTQEKIAQLAMDMGLDGANAGYIPDNESVLFHTCLIQPETTQSIYFTAPEPGDYPFLCSFPGHAFVMKGIMRVR